ncbi:toprim domain-containing protein [Endozoicomonas acroporae]|uniref:toprim domain-containing protein n=1 Tax=Endozoicomonas acroporae TaxID=1701104 RepID=UPI0013D3DEDD|nr:toprim domain-containing protein [Endozoicomonas acroporae]
MNQNFKDWCLRVKHEASRDWPGILQALAGLNDQQTDAKKSRSRGAPCPACGGTDRYSFKAPDSGGWACRRCGGGDGWELLSRVNSWNFSQAIKEVACYLHIEPYQGKAPTPKQQTEARQEAEKRRTEHKAKQEQEQQRLSVIHDQRADYALQEWSHATPARENHPYLISHKLPPFNLREIQHPVYGWCLLVPLINEHGQLRNLERINPEGMKRPVKGAQKQGLFYQFGGDSWTKYICEGWATGAAIHLNKPCRPSVLCAMSAGNMKNVTTIARLKYPESDIVIAADHDPAGIQKAFLIAQSFNLKVVVPDQAGADFCDLHIQEASL